LPSFDEWFAALGRSAGTTYETVWAAAYGADQHVGQQGYLTATAIVDLGRAVGAGPGQRVLDVCCGPGAAVALLTRRLDCSVVGVDRSLVALQTAAHRRDSARYVRGDATCLPFAPGVFDAVVMFDSMLAIRDKAALLQEVARVLVPGGRFGCSVEVGAPLDAAERTALGPHGLGHVLEEATLLDLLAGAGLALRRRDDITREYVGVAERLAAALVAAQGALAQDLGAPAVDDVLANTRAWADLFRGGRVAMLTVVAQHEPTLA
jgi:sarcosine/dimethylglycine N-methyltransferase